MCPVRYTTTPPEDYDEAVRQVEGASHQGEGLTPALSEIETAIRVAAAKGDASPFDSVRLRNMRRLAGDDSPNVWTKKN